MRKGYILVYILVVVIILFLVANLFLHRSRDITEARSLLKEKAQISASLLSYVNLINFQIIKNSLNGTCNSVAILGKQVSLTGTPTSISTKGKVLIVKIRDLSSFLPSTNIDMVDLRALLELLGYGKSAPTIESSIEDWYDRDNIPRTYGAECDFYKNQGVAYCPRNSRAIQHKREFSLIKGIDNSVYKKLSGLISDHATGIININTAPDVLLKVLLKERAEFFIRLRRKQCIRRSDILKFLNDEISVVPAYGAEVTLCILDQSNGVFSCAAYTLSYIKPSGPLVRDFRFLGSFPFRKEINYNP
jgi:type II secretory pathway component PulK